MISRRLTSALNKSKNTSQLFRPFSFKFEDLEVELSSDTSPVELDVSKLKFGALPSRHMFEVDYVDGKWHTPKIRPFQSFSMHPFNMTLHYAITCFEGLKAYKGPKGELRMFRPEQNMKRFLDSCNRLMLPEFNKAELLKCMEELIRVDKDWVPQAEGASLYIRPFAFAMDHELGVRASNSAKIMIVSCPVGPYFPTGVKPIKLAIVRRYERGNPKSAACYKLGSNYGPTCLISSELAKEGYSQALWTHNDNILEVGACNIFFLLKGKNGRKELITPPLDGSVLPGITRKSIIELVQKEHPEIDMVVRDFTVSELTKAFKDGRVIEVFGAGTAVCIVPVEELFIDGKKYFTDAKDEEGWDFAKNLWRRLSDIQYGRVKHEFGHRIK